MTTTTYAFATALHQSGVNATVTGTDTVEFPLTTHYRARVRLASAELFDIYVTDPFGTQVTHVGNASGGADAVYRLATIALSQAQDM